MNNFICHTITFWAASKTYFPWIRFLSGAANSFKSVSSPASIWSYASLKYQHRWHKPSSSPAYHRCSADHHIHNDVGNFARCSGCPQKQPSIVNDSEAIPRTESDITHIPTAAPGAVVFPSAHRLASLSRMMGRPILFETKFVTAPCARLAGGTDQHQPCRTVYGAAEPTQTPSISSDSIPQLWINEISLFNCINHKVRFLFGMGICVL